MKVIINQFERLIGAKWFPYFFIFLGIVLRVVWVEDMEWHFDANWMFNKSQEIISTGNWPLLGMENGARFLNPGLSVWIFGIFAFFTDDPMGMTRIVMSFNVLAVLGFLLFILKKLDQKEKALWLWGLALASVGPLTILWSRKIWAQDILPIFSLLIILSHFHRHKIWGSFLWGMVGAAVGQIHMSGFFYSFGLFAVTLIHDLVNDKKDTRWFIWILGSCVGSIGLLPWLFYLSDNSFGHKRELKYILQFRFYTFWFLESLGIHLKYILKDAFLPFLKGPNIFGIPTFISGALHAFLYGASLLIIRNIFKSIKEVKMVSFRNFDFLKGISHTDLIFYSILLGMGGALTLSSVKLYPHYLVILFPFIQIWTVKMLGQYKKILGLVVISNAMISVIFYTTIHLNDGIENSHYGKTYKQKCLVEQRSNCHED